MEAYVYQAALLCADCAVITMNEFELFNMLSGSSSPFRRSKPWTDSDRYPQGPYPSGGGEADNPQHCDACGVFLENPLTGDGSRYVNEHLIEHARDGSGDRDVLATWAKYYNAQSAIPVKSPARTSSSSTRSTTTTGDLSWPGGSQSPASCTPGTKPPAEWKYEPGIRPIDPDDHKAPLVAGATTPTLLGFMEVIEADAGRLKAEGKEY